MKRFFTVLFFLPLLGLSAQTYTDCNNQSESISQWINAGTPLLVASKGFDCSICVSQAPMVGNWAANNPNVRVWGAMTYTYNQGATPTCGEVVNWVSNHGWQGVFSFVDANRDFYASGTPRYYVYEPISGMVVYDGFSFNQATQVALSHVNTVSVGETSTQEIQVAIAQGELIIRGPIMPYPFRLIDLTGREVLTGQGTGGEEFESIPLKGIRSGIYLLQVDQQVKKVLISR